MPIYWCAQAHTGTHISQLALCGVVVVVCGGGGGGGGSVSVHVCVIVCAYVLCMEQANNQRKRENEDNKSTGKKGDRCTYEGI